MVRPTFVDPTTVDPGAVTSGTPNPATIEYPDTDGLPMAESTLQFRWIVTLKEGISALFASNPQVFVAGDLLWYPVEGEPRTNAAPDTMVVFGRAKGDRPSYMQWVEGGIAPQVVIEVLSPGNRPAEMREKREFYERFGVEEYYVYDPQRPRLEVWQRRDDRLERSEFGQTWTSPRLGIRFDLTDCQGATSPDPRFPPDREMVVWAPDGSRFLTFEELALSHKAAIERAEQERQRANQERQRANQERQRAEQERGRAEQARSRADTAETQAQNERERADALEAEIARLRAQLNPGRPDSG